MITYFIILLAVFTILSVIFSISNIRIIEKQTLSYNNQLLQSVNSYLDTKYKNLKNYAALFYVSKDTPAQDRYLNEFLTEQYEWESTDYYQIISKVDAALRKNILRQDGDIKDVIVFRTEDEHYYRISGGGVPILHYEEFITNEILRAWKAGSIHDRFFYIPTFMAQGDDRSKPAHLLYVFDVIRDPGNFTRPIGIIALGLYVDQFDNAYKYFKGYMKGKTLILDRTGQVLFDTSGKEYGSRFFHADEILDSGKDVLRMKDSLIAVSNKNRFGFYTLNMISYQELYADVFKTIQGMVLIVVISVLIILGLTYWRTILFSRRMRILMAGIRKIQEGDLTSRIPVGNHADEITEISENIDRMKLKLKEYIDRMYVSELKKKEAELYALQSQINPHFLYNALEVLRMYALQCGNIEISRATRSLAELFRRTIREELVVTVKEEIEFCRSFLDFYNIKYQGRVNGEFLSNPKVGRYYMLKHLLQPILENIIVHGIKPDEEECVITVQSGEEGNDVVLTISDNGQGMDEERLQQIRETLEDSHYIKSESIGLLNVHSRIRMVYGEGYGITLSSSKGQGTTVTLRFKAMTREELLSYVQGHDRG